MTKQEFVELSETDQLWEIDRLLTELRSNLHDHGTKFEKHGTLQQLIAVQQALGLDNTISTMIKEAHEK